MFELCRQLHVGNVNEGELRFVIVGQIHGRPAGSPALALQEVDHELQSPARAIGD